MRCGSLWFVPLISVSFAGEPLDPPEASSNLFGYDGVHRIHLTLSEDAMAALRTQPRDYVRCDLAAEGKVYTNVAIRLKGGIGSFRVLNDKPSFTLNMGRFQKGQEFFGLNKFHLNNSVQDSTYLMEIVSTEMFRNAGIPATRATHAVVRLNDRTLGLYVLKEGFDRRFLARHFEDPSGNLYDGGAFSDVDEPLHRNSGERPLDHADLMALVRAANAVDVHRWKKLQERLEMDRFLSFLAMEIMTWHWDGYAMHKNNYRLYGNPTTGKFVFLPHGMDQMFFTPDGPVEPYLEGLVAKAVLETEEGRGHYRIEFRRLFERCYDHRKICALIDRLERSIGPVIHELDRGEAQRHDAAVEDLRQKVRERFSSLERQLGELDASRLGAD